MVIAPSHTEPRNKQEESSQRPVRNVDIGRLQDAFLITAAGTIIVIRLQLWATNYPKLGGGGLHIAHLLWGGLFMLVAIGMLVSFLGREWRMAAAVLGGVGFGFFIDELGKFITEDNNYFFKPTASIIYIAFILLYFVTRRMQTRRGFSQREYVANAFDLVSAAGDGRLRTDDRARALVLLRQAGDHPLVEPLVELIGRCDAIPPPPAGRLRRRWGLLCRRASDVAQRGWFRRGLVWAFALWAAATLAQAIVLVGAIGLKLGGAQDLFASHALGRITIPDVAALSSSTVAAVLVAVGIARLRGGDRIAGYRMLGRALLIEIFITQIFLFVQSSFAATTGLLISLALLVSVRRLEGLERASSPVAALRTVPPPTTTAAGPTSAPGTFDVSAGGSLA